MLEKITLLQVSQKRPCLYNPASSIQLLSEELFKGRIEKNCGHHVQSWGIVAELVMNFIAMSLSSWGSFCGNVLVTWLGRGPSPHPTADIKFKSGGAKWGCSQKKWGCRHRKISLYLVLIWLRENFTQSSKTCLATIFAVNLHKIMIFCIWQAKNSV